MKHKSRNILPGKRKRGVSADRCLTMLHRDGANVCVGVDAMCRPMSGKINQVKIYTI